MFFRRWKHRKERELLLLQAHYGDNASKLRFRKRDKIEYYGRRMLRKVKNVSGQVYGGQGRKRKAVMRFAKSILQLKRESIPMQLKTVEPPAEYLEETSEGGGQVPPDALYMLQSIRIFGHFEKPIFLKLCKHTEIINLEPNEFLFKITDNDDSVFIIQSGLVDVYINNADGSVLPLKTVRAGETVTSLLSFIDVLSGNKSIYKTITAKAVEKSQVIRLPMDAFKEIFEENPDIMIRVVQVIMIRLQRVIFTALRNYLGLNSELVQSFMRSKNLVSKNLPAGQNTHQRKSNEEYHYQHSLSESAPPDMLLDLTGNQNDRRMSITCSTAEISIDAKLVYASAMESLLEELGLEDEDRPILERYLEVSELEPGVTLTKEGNTDDVCLWYVMTGSLAVYQDSTNKEGMIPLQTAKHEVYIYTVHPGEVVGALACLTGEASTYTIRTKCASRIAIIRRSDVYQIMRQRPEIILNLANCVVRRLSPLARQCDFALDWVFLESGRAIYRQEESSDSTYIVLSGRLRSVITHTKSGKKEIVGEYGKGDLIGIVEMITETSRTTTVMAVRDSELAKLPQGLFNAIKLRYPIVVTKLINLLSHRILQSRPGSTPLEANPVTHKFSTVALVPVNDDVPLTAFTYELYHSLGAIGPSLRLTSEIIRKKLGSAIFESSSDYRLTSWLAQQEDRNIITLYQCDSSLSAWTQRCMRQADVILIVGLGDRAPTVGKFEREIDRLAMRTQKELVLLHHESSQGRPTNTLQWLNMRPWVTNHHHIQCLKRMFTRRSQYRIVSFNV